MQATLTSKGQITVPNEIRKVFSLQTGDVLEFEADGDEIRIRPLRHKSAAQMRGMIKTQVPYDPIAEREAMAEHFADRYLKRRSKT
jgi:antitoxin PrlF